MNPLKSIFQSAMKNRGSALVHGGFFAVNVLSSMTEDTTEGKIRSFGEGILINQLAHHPNGWISAAKGFGLSIAFSVVPELAKGVGSMMRSGLENRTSMAIPFGHQTLNMQMANSSLRNAQQRISRSYGNLGNEASIFAARYLRR